MVGSLLVAQVGQPIDELTAIDSVAVGDSVAIYDASGSDTNKATLTQVLNGITDAGTDPTADLEEETHVTEHEWGGADVLEINQLGSDCGQGDLAATHDLSDVDCADGFTWDIVSGLVSIVHQTDAAAVQSFSLIGPNRVTPVNNDEIQQSFTLESLGGNHEYGRFTLIATSVADGSETGTFDLDLIGGGALQRSFVVARGATTVSSTVGLLESSDQIQISATTADGTIAESGTTNGLTISSGVDITLSPTSGAVYLSDALVLNPTDSPVACAGGTEGAIYYDASVNEICFCNGSSYAQVDGGGACV